MSATDLATLPPTTTTELLHDAVEGDQSAWQELVRRFEPAVGAIVTAHRFQEADARDAAQRTWLQLLEHHHQIREPEALGGWLRTTAKRECLRIIEDQRRAHPVYYTEDAEYPDSTVDVEERVVEKEVTRQLRRLMQLLPARSLALMTSLFQDDPPGYAQLAHSTGIPIGSIGPTRARALSRLRQLIENDREPSRELRCRM
jgi:RNA polymerase sigma factor (sigma-70 family)